MFQVPASLSERLDELADSLRSLVGIDHEIGSKEQDGKNDWHVDVRDPVATVEQGAPDAPDCRSVQRPSLSGNLRRLALRPPRRRSRCNVGLRGGRLGCGVPWLA